VTIAGDGGFVAAGAITNTNNQNTDAFLMKTDSLGNFLWAKSYGGISYDYAQEVKTTSDNGYAIAAVTYSSGAGSADYFIIRADSSGNTIWTRTIGGVADDRSESIAELSEGGYLVSGESSSFSAGHFDVFVVRLDLNGDTLWTKITNGLQNNEGYGMVITGGGAIAITGTHVYPSTSNDVLFLKYDSLGIFGCNEIATAATVGIPSVQIINYTLTALHMEPQVSSHPLSTSSGTSFNLICLYDGIQKDREVRVSVFPNPASERLHITLEKNIREVRITDALGNCVKRLVASQRQTSVVVDVYDLSPGIYLVEVLDPNITARTKFIRH
jgi:hypothetical protein